MTRATFSVLLALAGCSLAGCNPKQDSPRATSQSATGGHDHMDHGKGQPQTALMVDTEPAQPSAGQPVALMLMVHNAKGAMVKDFEVVHEKKMHLIIVRDGLDHFAHIHPDIDAAGNAKVTYTFPTGGLYRLYADHKPVGGTASTAVGEVKVAGAVPPQPGLKPDAPGKVMADGLQTQISADNLKPGGEATIRFELLDAGGKAVTDLQPYMGARGHLVVISQDGKEYVHAHPDDAKPASPNVVVFMAHFGTAGLYKGWGQFQRMDKVVVMPFVVEVK